MMNMAPVNAEN